MAKVMAVAVNTMKQALRMKIAWVVVLLLVVLLPLLAWGSTGDGTVKGRLQTFISYSLSLTSLILSVLTILVTAHTATSDIVHRQVFTVLSKPIRRWQFVLGKFLGVFLLDLSLLTLAAVFIFVVVVSIPRFMSVSPSEQAQIESQFYTARAALKPKVGDVNEAEIQKRYEQLERSGDLARFAEEGIPKRDILTRLRTVAKLEMNAAGPSESLLWQFRNVRLFDPNDKLFVRFKYDVSVTPPDSQVYSYWEVGDDRQYQSQEPATTPFWKERRRDAVRTVTEFAVPAAVIAEDGYLGLRFVNAPMNDTVVIFPLGEGLAVMYQVGTFTHNFLRAILLILFRLVYLTAFSLFAASFLSFPVAVLLCFMVFVMVSICGFLLDSFTYMDKEIQFVYDVTLKPLLELLPQFDRDNPVSFMLNGRMISTLLLAKAAGIMIGLWTSVYVGLGLRIYSRREVGR